MIIKIIRFNYVYGQILWQIDRILGKADYEIESESVLYECNQFGVHFERDIIKVIKFPHHSSSKCEICEPKNLQHSQKMKRKNNIKWCENGIEPPKSEKPTKNTEKLTQLLPFKTKLIGYTVRSARDAQCPMMMESAGVDHKENHKLSLELSALKPENHHKNHNVIATQTVCWMGRFMFMMMLNKLSIHLNDLNLFNWQQWKHKG